MNLLNISSNLTDQQFQSSERSNAEIVLWSALLLVLTLLSITGNIFVIACIKLHHRLSEDKGNIFLINLAVSDLGTAVIVMSSSLLSVAADGWMLGPVWCDLVCAANYTLIIVSMMTLCFISLDRYMAVVHALHYHRMVTSARVYALLVYAWLQGVCFGVAPMVAGWILYDYWEIVCAIQWNESHTQTLIYVTVAFILCFICPGVVMVIAYWKVMKVAKSHNSVQPMGFHDKVTATSQRAAILVTELSENWTSLDIDQNVTTSSPEQTQPEVLQELEKEDFHTKRSSRCLFLKEKHMKRIVKLAINSEETKQTDIASVYGQLFPPALTAAGADLINMHHITRHKHFHRPSVAGEDTVVLSREQGKKDSPNTSLAWQADVHVKNMTSSRDIMIGQPTQPRSYTGLSVPPVRVKSTHPPKRPRRNYGVSSKAMRSLMIVVLAFFVCMTPFSCTKLYKVIDPQKEALPGYANLIASMFQYCSSAVNPLIYGIFRKDFRSAFHSLWKKCTSKVRNILGGKFS